MRPAAAAGKPGVPRHARRGMPQAPHALRCASARCGSIAGRASKGSAWPWPGWKLGFPAGISKPGCSGAGMKVLFPCSAFVAVRTSRGRSMRGLGHVGGPGRLTAGDRCRRRVGDAGLGRDLGCAGARCQRRGRGFRNLAPGLVNGAYPAWDAPGRAVVTMTRSRVGAARSAGRGMIGVPRGGIVTLLRMGFPGYPGRARVRNGRSAGRSCRPRRPWRPGGLPPRCASRW